MSTRSVSYSPAFALPIPFTPSRRSAGATGAQRISVPLVAARSTVRERIALDGQWRFCAEDRDSAASVTPSTLETGEALTVPYSASPSLSTPLNDAASGWWLRDFEICTSEQGRRIVLELEGVFGISAVWINGKPIGQRASAYLGCRYDLTPHVEFGETNTLMLRVDSSVSAASSRRRRGTGRAAWLLKTNPLHVAQYGVYVGGEFSAVDTVCLSIGTMLHNETASTAAGNIVSTVVDADGRAVGQVKSGFVLFADERSPWEQTLIIRDQGRFANRSGMRYSVTTRIEAGGWIADEVRTPFDLDELADGRAQKSFVMKRNCGPQITAGV